MKTRVLALTRYDEMGASSRYRFLQYIPLLESMDLEIDVAPLLGNDYIAGLYGGDGKKKGGMANAYLKRIARLLRKRPYDVIWIEKEALPFIPGGIERLLLGRKVPYVLDYDDAVFHNMERLSNPIARRLLHKKYDRIMQGAAVVVAGNPYIADYAREAGAKRVEIVPTVVDLRKYEPASRVDGDDVRIGWIGTPITARYLEIIRDYAVTHEDNASMRFTFIGSGDVNWGVSNVDVLPWSASSEASDLESLSVGIMPLVDSSFERGKCGLKLLQYMAASLPVIASPVGVNRDIVEHGVNGFLAETPEEWERAIQQLSSNPQMRVDFGHAGREKVEQQYSLEQTAPRVKAILESAANRIRP